MKIYEDREVIQMTMIKKGDVRSAMCWMQGLFCCPFCDYKQMDDLKLSSKCECGARVYSIARRAYSIEYRKCHKKHTTICDKKV